MFSVVGAMVAAMGGLLLMVFLKRVAPETLLGILVTGLAVSLASYFAVLLWFRVSGQWERPDVVELRKVAVMMLGTPVLLAFAIRAIVNLGGLDLKSHSFGMPLVRALWSFVDLFR